MKTSVRLRAGHIGLLWLLGTVIPLLGIRLADRLLPFWHWRNAQVWAVLEAIQGVICILALFPIVTLESTGMGRPAHRWIGCALISFGVPSLLEAFFPPGGLAIWLDSVLFLTSGALLLPLWWRPSTPNGKPGVRLLPLVLSFTVATSTLSIFFFDHLPAVLQNDRVTPYIRWLGTIGASLLFAGAVRFFLEFRRTREPEDLVFGWMFQSLALSPLVYGFVTLWDVKWWLAEIIETISCLFLALAIFLANQRQASLLRAKTDDLARSNTELEQFGFLISHDLREPLRMISSFLMLIEKRYADRLDRDGKDFIHFAVDGAQRMHRLIDDLLELSRVTSRGKPFLPTDSAECLRSAVQRSSQELETAGGNVTAGPLPVLRMDPDQLIHLFRELIRNALKYRSDRVPEIRVSARKEGVRWLLSVRDNGIGIPSNELERIFLVFQRLHGHGEYSGTGIGLAICKKIVERHGGEIWAESVPGEGTTVSFAVPA